MRTCMMLDLSALGVFAVMMLFFLPPTTAFHSCIPELVDDHFPGKSARCVCSLPEGSDPGHTAQWFYTRDDQAVGSGRDITVTYDKDYAGEQIYTCEIISSQGRKAVSILIAKFAFFDSELDLEASLCDGDSFNQTTVTCRVSREHVSPVPVFQFSVDGLPFDGPQSGSVSGVFYQRQASLEDGGQHQVLCRATNLVLNTRQEAQINVTNPPPSPPKITIQGQTYQGVNEDNIASLAEGYTGEATCSVEGGYPDAHSTQLRCGQLVSSGGGSSAALTFTTTPLSRDMSGTVCTCTAQHDSGCYEKMASVTLRIVYPPDVSFTQSPAGSQPLREGDQLDLTCSTQGRPAATSVTLTRERTNEVLMSVQTPELNHTIGHLSCLDTGVYECSSQNSQGTTIQQLSIGVRCPQHISESFTPRRDVGATIGSTARIDNIEIYGFPEPSVYTLTKSNEDTNLESSGRHSVRYTPTVPPFGLITVAISSIVEADFTNYTLTVDNLEGDALVYWFYLNKATVRQDVTGGGGGGGSEDGVLIGIGVGVAVLAVLIVAVVVAVVVMVRRRRDSRSSSAETAMTRTHLSKRASQYAASDACPYPNNGYLTPLDLPPIADTMEDAFDEAPVPSHYATVDDYSSTIRETPTDGPVGSNEYETIDDLEVTSGPYLESTDVDLSPAAIETEAMPLPSGNCANIDGLCASEGK